MPEPGSASRIGLALCWLPVGAAMLAVSISLAWTRWPVLLTGHPALLAGVIAVGLIGLVGLIWAVASLTVGQRYDTYADDGAGELRTRTRAQMRRRALVRIGLGVPILICCIGLTLGLVWLRPFPADPIAVAAMRSSDSIRVADRLTWYELAPTARDAQGVPIRPTVGLVFIPGARVDPRAYAHILRPVAAAGYLVAVVKPPLNVALPNSTGADVVLSNHPEIRRWVLGGHGAGGVAAASYAADHQTTGLLLYGSAPTSSLPPNNLTATVISGSADALTTPEEVAEARPRLPEATRYVEIVGGIHAYFGDYGEQPGDGVPTISRQEAQARIQQATIELMSSISPRPKPR